MNKINLFRAMAGGNEISSFLNNFTGGSEVSVSTNSYGGTGRQWYISQNILYNLYWRTRIENGDNSEGQIAAQISRSNIVEYYRGYNLSTTVAVTHNGSAVFDDANPTQVTRGNIQIDGTDQYLELVTEDNCTAVGAVMSHSLPTAAAMCLITIDSNNTLADLLPTAQELVTAGSLTSDALVANGGTLNPTDRVMDTYDLANNTAGPLVGSVVFFSKTLTAGIHTVRITETAYYHVGSSGGYVRMPCIFAGGPDYGRITDTDAFPVFYNKQNVYTYAFGNPVWEISYSTKPTGATGYEWVGHSGSLLTKTVPSITVDGDVLTPTDYVDYPGSAIAIITQHNIRHSETGTTDLGVLDLTYTFNNLTGLTISHSLAWAVAGVCSGYPGMLNVDHATFDRYNTLGSGAVGTDLADDDDAINFNVRKQVLYCWDYDGYSAVVMYIPSLTTTVENWTNTTTRQFYWVDISTAAGVWKKAYASRFQTDVAFTDATVYDSSINYRAGWFTTGADNIFGDIT